MSAAYMDKTDPFDPIASTLGNLKALMNAHTDLDVKRLMAKDAAASSAINADPQLIRSSIESRC